MSISGPSADSRSINDIMPSAETINDSLNSFLDGEWETEIERRGNYPAKVRAYVPGENQELVARVDDSNLTMTLSYRRPGYEQGSKLNLGYDREEIDLREVEPGKLPDKIEETYNEVKDE